MPIVPVYLNVDEKTYAEVKNGIVELCGMAKNIGNKQVAKHIPVVADAVKDRAIKAIDFVRGHKKETFIVSGIIVLGSAAAGTFNYVSRRKQRKLDEQFAQALQNYLDSAKYGALTLEILNDLIESIEASEKQNPKKGVKLNVPAAQLSELVYCIYDYTLRLAEANNFNTQTINRPKFFENKTANDIKYYLGLQKQIFEQAA